MDLIDWENLPLQTTPLNKTMLKRFQDNINNGKVDKSMTEYAGDLNDLVTTGYYTTTSNTTNKPTNDNYYVEVIRQSSGYILQRATMRSAVPRVYTRQLYGSGNWRPWLEIPAIIVGTWTPTLSTAEALSSANPTVDYTITSASDRGSYKKFGDMVFISFYVRGRITALNGTDNYAAISGLPFNPKILAAGENVIPLGTQYNCINGDPTDRWCFHRI